MENVHSLLRRQLKRYFRGTSSVPQELSQFTQAINEAYKQFDEDRILFERSLEISSRELFQVNSYLQGIITSSVDGIFAFDQKFHITVWNPGMATITGMSTVEALGQYAPDLLPFFKDSIGLDFFLVRERNRNVIPNDKQYILSKSGEKIFIESRHSFLKNQSGDVLGGISIIRDVTDRRHSEEEQKQTLSLLNATLESTTDGILVVDKEGKKILKYNEQFLKLWNIPECVLQKIRETFDDRPLLAHVSSQIKDPVSFFKKVMDLYSHPEEESFDTLELADGRIFERYSKPQRVGEKNIGRVWSFRDVTRRRKDEERLNYLANFDSLTALPNRTLFHDRLGQAISRASWNKRAVAVLFLDLDRFKNINDTFGHTFGDLLLKAVAERLRKCIRDGDTVARLGGDEFVIILDDLATPNHTLFIAEKILSGLSKPFVLQDRELYITTSIGIAIYPNDGDHYEMLIRNADTAMYRAKEQGKNNYQIYSPELNEKVSERLALENSLRHAMERDEFLLYYQPKIDLISGKIIGVEALIRWLSPVNKQIVLPGEFISLAEEIGLILPMGEWVLQAACAQNKAWQMTGLTPIGMAINISATQFQQQNLSEMISNTLKESGLDPKYLELEITESTIMKSAENAEMTLKRLDELGIDISIDDFGTGYSSLGYLKRFPVSTLKIDRTFVRDISTNSDDKRLVGAIITLAHSLKLKVVAEGVETREQLHYLQSVGCDQIQGFLFSKPLSGKEMTQLLIQNRPLR
ncbi:MAG: EAL domain-containing protein [Nitrospirae bacterium]|nr:EAL domain-containing protein [Nitrospirota bacterium]